MDGADEVTLTGERRLATVLLADVKSSTDLLEQIGSEAWVELMNRLFQILGSEIYRYGGKIDQYRGDGLVAFFGAREAHEDDPERAVLAALAIQEAIKRYASELAEWEEASTSDLPRTGGAIELLLRIGVNTGEVIAVSVGDSRQHREDTVMGEAVALAARMEAAAEPGTVLVSENTYRLARRLFEWEPLGEIAVKGMNQRVAAYRPLAHKRPSGKGRGIAGLRSPLVGRRGELRALQEAVERLRAGAGGIVTLVGEAGIGKSRLVAEVKKSASLEAVNLQWIEGRCLSYDISVPYQLWLDMLREWLGAMPDAPPAEARETLREWLRALCADGFDDVYPYIGRLMSLPLEDEDERMLRGLGVEGLKAGTFGALESLIESAARQRPLVIVCEDLQWADPTSLELLEHLLSLTDRVPLLLLCIFRPETERGSWRIREAAAQGYGQRHVDLQLDPLSAVEGEALVDSLLLSVPVETGEAGRRPTVKLSPVLRERILARAEGNPFFIEEIVRSLVESGAVACDESTCRWEATRDPDEIVLPDTLRGVLAARIDRLSQEAKRVLQLASVVGRVFGADVLRAIVEAEAGQGLKTQELDEHLLTLQREQMIRQRARVPEVEYVFQHPLIQEVAYDSLLKRECRVLHRRVAQALERLHPERTEKQIGLLAYHWERARAD